MWGAIASIAGNVLGGLLGKEGQDDANAANAEQAQAMMDFQERMSNTSYQRGMKDMQKAGLNPMLAFMKGGASTPSGSMATMQNELKPLGDAVRDITPAAVAVKTALTNNANTEANTLKANADTDLASAQAAETRARTPTYASTIQLNQANVDKIRSEIPKILSDTDLSQELTFKAMAEVNKIVAEAKNVPIQGELLQAQIREALARASLSTAQIAEVQPKIANMISETNLRKAELPFVGKGGSIADTLRFGMDLPDYLLQKSGASASSIYNDVTDVGRYVFPESAKAFDRAKQNLYWDGKSHSYKPR